ncbi:hypothetical protein [Streptomyces asoensis]|uniref:hypothetical protein n=1 Tax=Streptomyces asoensis TaxID=249586 RepID=UPI0033EB60D7
MSILRPDLERPRERRPRDEPRAGRPQGGGVRSRDGRPGGEPRTGPRAERAGGWPGAVRVRVRPRAPGARAAVGVGAAGIGAGTGVEAGPRGGAFSRAFAFVGRTLRGEWYGIVVDPLRQLRRRGPAALLLAFVACAGVIFFHAIAQHRTGATAVRVLGGVQGDLPLWLALLRTPVSLYVPALDLPVWAGITQLFLAFALAELALGRRRTLLIAYASTLAGTLSARVMMAMGPGRWGLGLPPEIGQVLDTGPSAAVVGLFTYLSVVRRAPVVFTLTGGSMVLESIAKPNLAGREHLIAVAAALVLGLLHERGRRRRRTAEATRETASA